MKEKPMMTRMAVSDPAARRLRWRSCGKPVNPAQEALLHRAKCNRAARQGECDGTALRMCGAMAALTVKHTPTYPIALAGF